jgi:hypothetical protein
VVVASATPTAYALAAGGPIIDRGRALGGADRRAPD